MAVAAATAVAAPDAIEAEPETQTVSPLDAIQAVATTDPRGGEEVSLGSTNGGVASFAPLGSLPQAFSSC
jgi:hypothetical protein